MVSIKMAPYILVMTSYANQKLDFFLQIITDLPFSRVKGHFELAE